MKTRIELKVATRLESLCTYQHAAPLHCTSESCPKFAPADGRLDGNRSVLALLNLGILGMNF
jgi:hypothetical protein